ncbi:pyridoxal phosphate-dependent transferase [Dactylonectria estremocensis]|uniref:Pyridoxal phosphate-dependent transferase n=1 Tax=Dactylonectria estremocensis TaxID=1079267 RepID=A0A9P9F3A5_9HYPO|nr:pyridoxal phosphate-dependent transferase [Dactylonectria estremocensis]
MSPSATADSNGASSAASPPAPLDLSHHYSIVTKNRDPSKIKSFYKFSRIPGISNFSGGMPNVKYFPYDTLEARVSKADRWTPSPNSPSTEKAKKPLTNFDGATAAVNGLLPDPDFDATSARITIPKILNQPDPSLKLDLSTALQYGLSQGYPPLYSFVRQFTRDVLHPNVPYKGGAEIIMTNGSTDGFSKVLELLVDPWYEGVHPVTDRPGFLCENFVFGNILSQSKPHGLQVVPVELDTEGMLAEGPGGLREVLENWDPKNGRRPHFIYTVTLGHNPTSGIQSVQRRKEIYKIASEFDLLIIEDEPYWYLQFPAARFEEAKSRGLEIAQSEEPYPFAKKSGYEFIDSLVPSYLNIDVDGRVIRLDTFSKTVAPGCRLGWITAQPALIERFERITEATTQQPSGFVQSLIAELIRGPQPAATVAAFNALSLHEKATFGGWQLDGWVRWLAGLRGEYERRMVLMCSILEENTFQLKQSTPVRQTEAEWGVITKTRILSFDWARGGMFVWARVHFENHPLFGAKGVDIPVLDGPTFASAWLIFTTHAPNLVLGSPGSIFSATPEIRSEKGWQYVRLCFAAESDENIEAGSRRYANALQKFWRIKEVAEIEKLVKELSIALAG